MLGRLLPGVLLAWALTGCQPSNEPRSLVFAVAQAPVNLDPRYATDAASERINRLLYQRLVEFDSRSREVPGLATWQMRDATHYRFQLYQPATFHDGQPLTAADVKATYDSLLQLKDSPHTAEFKHIQQITTLDANTIDFELSRPDPHFAARLMVGILPARLIAAGHDFGHAPVGSGPFKLDRWQSVLQLQRLSDGLKVRFDEVKDPNVRVLKLKRGEADLIQGDLPPELVKYLQKQPNVTVKTGVGANYSYLGLNVQADFLRDVRVRRAIAYAIDTRAIIDKVMVSHSRQASAGIKLPLTLTYKTSTDPQRVRLATILQAQMQEAGIDLQIKSLDWGTFFADVQKGNFQLYGLTWVGIKTPEIYSQVFASHSLPPQGFNRGRYQDGVLDQLLEKEDWPAVTQRIHSQLPVIPLWYEGQFVAYRDTIAAYQPMADGNLDGLSQVVFKPVKE